MKQPSDSHPATPQPGPYWVKSSRSHANGNCVEVAGLPDGIGVRDSKHTTGPILRFTQDEWRTFVGRVRAGSTPTG